MEGVVNVRGGSSLRARAVGEDRTATGACASATRSTRRRVHRSQRQRSKVTGAPKTYQTGHRSKVGVGVILAGSAAAPRLSCATTPTYVTTPTAMGVPFGVCCPPPQRIDEDDDDDNLRPWPDDVSASGYPRLIMSEPPLVYILAEANTWPPAMSGPICHEFVRATPVTL